jgi:uncharacterized protein (DUF1684 family)
MDRIYRTWFVIAFAFLLIGGCSKRREIVDQVRHRKEIEEWQASRRSRITREDGWLTLVGLFWLKPGTNTVGSDSSNAVILPAGKTPSHLGTISLTDGKLRFEATRGVTVISGDSVIQAIDMLTDEGGKPTILRHGTVSFYVIKRGEQLGVRVKDSGSETRTHFAGLEYFPIETKFRFDARFEPYTPPKIMKIATQSGTVDEESSPGSLVFEYEGTMYRLDVIIEKGAESELFIMFADATSGAETYGPGRQLYTALPDSNGTVVLDFNRAYNWPCVFTDFATCPIPPRQNHLPFRVEAGEKMYRGHH